MTAASPRTSPSALRSPLPPSITHSTRPSSVSPRASRSCSSSVHTTAFYYEPSRRPSGPLLPSRVIARTPITVCRATTMPSMNSATTSSPSRRRVRCSCSRCRVRRTTVRLTALLLLPRVGRPLGRLETAFVVAHRHPGEQLLHHPRGQRVPVAKRRDRRQRRFPADRRPHAGAAHLHAPPAEGELRCRRAPVMMGARPLMPAFGTSQRHGLLAKQLIQRGQPVRMDPREQVLARGRHPGEHRLPQVCSGAGPAPFFACVRCALAVLFVIGGSLAPALGTVCLGRRDSHADQGAVATQFSSSTGAGTSPLSCSRRRARMSAPLTVSPGHCGVGTV